MKHLKAGLVLSMFFVLISTGMGMAATYDLLLEGVFSGDKPPNILWLSEVNGRSLPGVMRYTDTFSRHHGRSVAYVSTTVKLDRPPSVFTVTTSYRSKDGRGGRGGPGGEVPVMFKGKVVVDGQEFYDVYYGRFER